MSPPETAELIEMLFGLRTWVGPGNHVLYGGPDLPWEGAKGKRAPIVKYRDTLRSPVRKQLHRSSCRLDCDLGMAQGIRNYMGVQIPHEKGQFWLKGRPL